MKIESQKRRLGFIYVLTIFLSAFLLFQVQPLISKSILPWFGGTPAVWTTCMLFFQVVLFGGYLYAHLTTQRLSPRRQGWLHIGLLLVALAMLGVGTLATYGRPGDSYRFYEINPEVIRLAERYFTFLTDCQAQVEHIVGDARLSLEHEPSQQFDVLILDAFSGDAIPAHLLTREAGEIYRRHLKPEGVLAVHISNLHFDLRPVVTGLGEHLGLVSSAVFSKRNDELGTKNSLWMVLSRDADRLQFDDVDEVPLPPNDRRILWTDHRSNLFEILR